MKVFLSWSGELSKSIALELREWLPQVIQGLKPWLSSEDIAKGSRWSGKIAEELAHSKTAVFCLTQENTMEPWLNFEAGAVSNTEWKTNVCTYLFDLKPTDFTGPLTQFQATVCTKDDTFRLVTTLNTAQGEGALEEKRLEKSFNKFWPDLENRLEEIRNTTQSAKPKKAKRSIEDMVEETLNRVREIQKQSDASEFKPLWASDPISKTPGRYVIEGLPPNTVWTSLGQHDLNRLSALDILVTDKSGQPQLPLEDAPRFVKHAKVLSKAAAYASRKPAAPKTTKPK
jgi:hypothetical protein